MTRAQVLDCVGDDAEVLFLEPETFDAAIVGVVERFGQPDIVCYDYRQILQVLQAEGMTEDEAIEWYEFNTVGAWVGALTPCFLHRPHAEGGATMETPIDIQQRLDDWLAGEPEAQKYIAKLYYVPADEDPPADATHTVQLQSQVAEDRELSVAVVVKAPYAGVLDSLLALVATQ